MVTTMTKFNVKLVELPKVKKSDKSTELIDFGKFTLDKKYRVYSVYSNETFTQFLVSDDRGVFLWISTDAFREK